MNGAGRLGLSVLTTHTKNKSLAFAYVDNKEDELFELLEHVIKRRIRRACKNHGDVTSRNDARENEMSTGAPY